MAGGAVDSEWLATCGEHSPGYRAVDESRTHRDGSSPANPTRYSGSLPSMIPIARSPSAGTRSRIAG